MYEAQINELKCDIEKLVAQKQRLESELPHNRYVYYLREWILELRVRLLEYEQMEREEQNEMPKH